jgi:hypothetical protein
MIGSQGNAIFCSMPHEASRKGTDQSSKNCGHQETPGKQWHETSTKEKLDNGQTTTPPLDLSA